VPGRALPNPEIADRLEAYAALLELAEADRFAVRAYRRAADLIRSTRAPVDELVRAGRARELRGIGPGIEARLRELVETGRLAEADELEAILQPELVGLARYLGVGTRRFLEIAGALGVRSAAEFREAAEAGRLKDARGVGAKTEARLLAALARERPARGLQLPRARALCEAVAAQLGGTVAGDARRWRDVCETLSVVCAAADARPVLDRFEALPEILTVIRRSPRAVLGATAEGAAVELVVAPPAAFGTELVRATGAPAYAQALEPLPVAATEEEVYAALGIPWCPPELRERPFAGEPPALVELGDVRGDLHVHTVWSDGRATVREMAIAARDRGYDYVAICDHTPSVGAVPGLTADDLRRQGEEIHAVNEELAPFTVFRGVECDIRTDGSLDLPDDVLAELDWVQASVHAGQRSPGKELTRRVREAMSHPAVDCLSHPKGRIVNFRPPNALDLDEILEVAAATGIALEVNGLPDRLDLCGEDVAAAVAAGVPIVVSTDAHSVAGLANMQLAVATARRGGARAIDVVNARPSAPIRSAERRRS
jgi:DNA polymerase (family 10)